jgi:hypothetical protein
MLFFTEILFYWEQIVHTENFLFLHDANYKMGSAFFS